MSRVSRKIAHDLGSPLTALGLLIDTLKEDPELLKKYASLLELGDKGIDRLKKIIEEIRAMDLIEENETTEIHVALEAVLADQIQKLSQLNMKIDRLYQAEPIFVKGSKNDITQLIEQRVNHLLKAASIGSHLKLVVSYSAATQRAHVDVSVDGVEASSVELFVQTQQANELLLQDFSTNEIEVLESQELVVIEDSDLVTRFWLKLSNESNVNCKAYTCWEEYSSTFEAQRAPFMSTFIIDLNFENSAVTGFEIIGKIKAKDPNANIYVCSGDLWDSETRKVLQKYELKFISKPIPSNLKFSTVRKWSGSCSKLV